MTTPSTAPGEFARADLVRLHTAVMRDRPAEMRAQADAWDDLAALLRSHGAVLTGRTERLADFTGATGTGYRDYLSRRATSLSAAADLATGNGTAWRAIATAAQRAQAELAAIHDDWDREGRPEGEARRGFDDRAREAMTAIGTETDFHKSGLADHGVYAELAPTGFLQSDRPESHLEGDRIGGSVRGVPATSTGDGVASPASQSSGPSPQLQAAAAPSPASAPTVTGQPVGPNAAPPPIPPAQIPPPRATATTPPSTPPRTAPGSSPARPPAVATRPVPRPPQTTVKPVIGARPGATGMAPSAGTRAPAALARPVIGARVTPKSNAPKQTLIGKDGVVRGAGTSDRSRTRRRDKRPAVSERGVVERLARPAGATDELWPIRTAGRGVIRPRVRRARTSDVSIDGLDD